MLCSKAELFEVLDRLGGLPTLVIGDVILDRYIWGNVARISAEAPVPIVDVRRVEDRLGGAANVVRNLRGLGCEATLCGLIGGDEEGKIVLDLLKKDGVSSAGVLVDNSRPTSLKTRVVAQKQQLLRIDREERSTQEPAMCERFAQLVKAQVEAAKLIIISDYGKGVVTENLMQVFDSARQAGLIGRGARPLVLDPHPANFALYRGISVAKPNRREAEQASGIEISSRETALEAGLALIKKWNSDMLLISLGEDGLAVVGSKDTKPLFLPTVAQEVFDVSGAGDTVTAVFGAALAMGASPAVAGDLANISAGVVVAEVGTASISQKKLRQSIERLAGHQHVAEAH
ncbi:MAG: D-glycero-beta-D-manno-heptose-7-phosphate kinase [Oligoflexia bacterium]|nr:D-glycero-beta-D-manno-heptose-7-phosphate kinase [Oligoflexia bacterium]